MTGLVWQKIPQPILKYINQFLRFFWWRFCSETQWGCTVQAQQTLMKNLLRKSQMEPWDRGKDLLGKGLSTKIIPLLPNSMVFIFVIVFAQFYDWFLLYLQFFEKFVTLSFWNFVIGLLYLFGYTWTFTKIDLGIFVNVCYTSVCYTCFQKYNKKKDIKKWGSITKNLWYNK